MHTWSKLDHPNVLPLIGITTQFDLTVSIVSPWMENGNARDFVHTEFVDPCPLVCQQPFYSSIISMPYRSKGLQEDYVICITSIGRCTIEM